VPHDECDCESEYGCPKCSVTLTLDVAAEDEEVTVTSGDLKSEDSSVVPVTPDIPITKLASGEKLTTEMRALIGRGSWHAKWQPVSRAVAKQNDDDSSALIIESLGQLPPREIVLRALAILSGKMGDMEEALAELEEGTQE
jgi:DNA-directed RNA polymerase subunit D